MTASGRARVDGGGRTDSAPAGAAEALANIGPAAVVPLLRVLIEKNASSKVRQGAHHVLRKLRGSTMGGQIGALYQALSGMKADVGVSVEAERALRSLAPKQ